MPLWFQPKPRSVMYCDFTGYRIPEMTKRRPVVVLRAHKRNRKLVYVVPLSTTPPNPAQRYHYHFACSPVTRGAPVEAWAKCDMATVVSTDRLSVARDRLGQAITVSPEELAAMRRCVALAYGFSAAAYICDGTVSPRKKDVDAG
jgi:uncharacterized protein YifN (PemK superfamily)